MDNKKNNAKYPDEIIEYLVDEKVFLLAVEQTVKIAEAENENEDDRTMAVLVHLAMLCYIQGMCKTANDLTSSGKLHDMSISAEERELTAVRNGQLRWEFAKTYCNDMLGIDLNPLGMLVVLKRLVLDEDTGIKNSMLSKALDTVAADLESIAKRELEEANAGLAETIHAASINRPELIPEFFRALEDIGTFNFNRNKYTTDTDRAKHDHIMELYGSIMGPV